MLNAKFFAVIVVLAVGLLAPVLPVGDVRVSMTVLFVLRPEEPVAGLRLAAENHTPFSVLLTSRVTLTDGTNGVTIELAERVEANGLGVADGPPVSVRKMNLQNIRIEKAEFDTSFAPGFALGFLEGPVLTTSTGRVSYLSRVLVFSSLLFGSIVLISDLSRQR